MGFKDILKQKVPFDVQRIPEFGILLSMVKEENIKDEKELKVFLESEIERGRRDIHSNETVPSSNRLRVEKAKWVDSLEKMKEIVDIYF